MKICYIAEKRGVHEERFIQGFTGLGHDVVFLKIEECDFEKPAPIAVDLFLVGPLHLAARFSSNWFSGTPYVCLSYAYDVLLEYDQMESASGFDCLLKSSVGLIADCQAVVTFLNQRDILPAEKIVRAWGLDQRATSLEERSTSNKEPFIFLSVRAHERLYRVPEIVSAFIEKFQGKEEFRLHIAGSGSEEETIRELIRASGMKSQIKMLGYLSETELTNQMQTASVYLSNTMVDGVSISLLQAMDRAIPFMVLSNVGACDDLTGKLPGTIILDNVPDALPNALERIGALLPIGGGTTVREYHDILEERACWDKNLRDISNFLTERAAEA